jgi:hypothetical protein
MSATYWYNKNSQNSDTEKSFFFFKNIIVVLVVHCDIYKSEYNIS